MNTQAEKPKPKKANLTLIEHSILPIDEAGAHVAAINAKYKGVVYDCNDKGGMTAARAARVEIRESRYAIEKARAGRVSELATASKAVSARAAELTAPLTEVETPIHSMIVTVEERLEREKTERERIAAERASAQQAIVRSIEALPGRLFGASVAELEAGLAELAAVKLEDLDDLFKVAAEIAIEEVGNRLKAAIVERTALDKQAAEQLAAQAKLEEQQRINAAAVEAARIENERILDEQRRAFEQEQFAARERHATEMAEQKRLAQAEQDARQIELDKQAAALREVQERQEREDKFNREWDDAIRMESERNEAIARAERDRIAEAQRIAAENEAIAKATLIDAATDSFADLCILGQGDTLNTRKLAAAIDRYKLAGNA